MEEKGFLVLLSFVISFITGSISIPMIVLLIFMISDYILGTAASIKDEQKFDIKKALWGIVKKLCYAVLILLAILVDLLIMEGFKEVGLEISYKAIFAGAATIYCCGVELLSCCRHLITLGAPVPGFLTKFAEFLQEKTEKVMQNENH